MTEKAQSVRHLHDRSHLVPFVSFLCPKLSLALWMVVWFCSYLKPKGKLYLRLFMMLKICTGMGMRRDIS